MRIRFIHYRNTENDKLIERKFHFSSQTGNCKIDDAAKENGKILAKWGTMFHAEGYWKTNNTGDILSYYSKSITSKTKIRVIAEVEVWENIGGNFKSIEANGTKKNWYLPPPRILINCG